MLLVRDDHAAVAEQRGDRAEHGVQRKSEELRAQSAALARATAREKAADATTHRTTGADSMTRGPFANANGPTHRS